MGLINEELRPVEFKDVFLLKQDREKIEKWAQSWVDGTVVKKGLILAGPPGYGKTSMAYALGRTMGWDMIEINGSETRTEEFIKRTIGMFSSYRDLLSFDKDQNIITKAGLIDEADHIHERSFGGGTGEKGGFKAVADILHDTKIPIIITMNEFQEFKRKKSSSISAILNACEVVNVEKLYERKGSVEYKRVVGTLTDKLFDYGQNHGLKPQRDVLLDIVSSNLPDLRAAINDAEAYLFSSVQNSNATGTRDSQSKVIFDTLKSVLHGPDFFNVRDAIRESDTDPDTLILWISKNIPLQSATFQSTVDSMNFLGKIDNINRKARRKLYFPLLSYVSDLEALFWTKIEIKKHVYIKFQFPSYLMSMSRTKKTRSSRNKVARSISTVFHMSTGDALHLRSIFILMEKLQKDFSKELLDYINQSIMDRKNNVFYGESVKQLEQISSGDMDLFLS